MPYQFFMKYRTESGDVRKFATEIYNPTAYFAKVLRNPSMISAFVVDKASGDIVKQVIRG